MHNIHKWKNEIDILLNAAEDQSPPDLLNKVFRLAADIGENGADALLDAHPDLLRYSPLLTRAYHQTVIGKEIAEIERLSALDIPSPMPFKAVAGEPTMVTYNRVGSMFDAVDFADCRRLIMVGCGRLPAAMFHVHDRTNIPEIIGLDLLPEAVAAARDLFKRLGYTRARVELSDGGSFDYAGAQIVLIANMVSPKAGVVSRIADTAPEEVRIVVRDPLSLGRLWSDSVERALDPRLEVAGRGDGSGHWSLSRDLYLKRRASADRKLPS